ncbi:hypothetical protein [Streptomyces sp. ISL-43]|uniref:hypothetical protein n=1 Tax=Streptomyces sp. ISL-43 TaxID=2819183 RepID=UPI0027E4FA7B|nr:hypothetical protein [Streptomyces sp. ISL-43]
MPGVGGGQVLRDLAGLLPAQRNAAAHRAQLALLVVAAEDEELGAVQDSSHSPASAISVVIGHSVHGAVRARGEQHLQSATAFR